MKINMIKWMTISTHIFKGWRNAAVWLWKLGGERHLDLQPGNSLRLQKFSDKKNKRFFSVYLLLRHTAELPRRRIYSVRKGKNYFVIVGIVRVWGRPQKSQMPISFHKKPLASNTNSVNNLILVKLCSFHTNLGIKMYICYN